MNSNVMNATAVAMDHGLTQSEREQARVYLQQTRDGIVGAIKGVSEAQWQFKPAPARWSIGQIAEHVAIVHERVLGPIREQLAAAPAPPERECQQVDAIVINQFPNRLTKFKAPGFIEPTGALTPSEALDRLGANYIRLTEYLESTPDLRQHAIEAMPLKAVFGGAHQLMDGYQWILAAAAHTERHTKQILEVMADADYPSD